MVGVYQLIKPEGPLDHLMLIKEWFLIVCKIFSINIRMVIDEMYMYYTLQSICIVINLSQTKKSWYKGKININWPVTFYNWPL